MTDASASDTTLRYHERIFNVLDHYRETVLSFDRMIVTDKGVASAEAAYFFAFWLVAYLSTTCVTMVCLVMAIVVAADYGITRFEQHAVAARTPASEDRGISDLRVICENLGELWWHADAVIISVQGVREAEPTKFAGGVLAALAIIVYADSYIYAWGAHMMLAYLGGAIAFAVPYLVAHGHVDTLLSKFGKPKRD